MKKGFTLIELLAVIVILAVIALIATPIILNIIEDSKKQSIISSANLYIDGLVKQIATKNLTNEFNPSSCTVLNGNISCDGTSLDYQVNGKKPDSGTVTFNNGIVTEYALCMSDYKVVKSGNNVTTTQDSNCNAITYTAYTLGELLQYDPVNNTKCTTGETCYKWRVITVEDTTSNSTITLQMDHNIINKSVWVNQTDYNDDTNWNNNIRNNKGPITALKALETATSSWDDSLKLNYSYDTSLATRNYGILSCTNGTCIVVGNTITTNLKARIITGEEVRAITIATGAERGTDAERWSLVYGPYYYFSNTGYILGTRTSGIGSTDLSWLIENTYVYADSGATSNTYETINYGYWTLSPYSGNSRSAHILDRDGRMYNSFADSSFSYGIRPVITIPKSVIDN